MLLTYKSSYHPQKKVNKRHLFIKKTPAAPHGAPGCSQSKPLLSFDEYLDSSGNI